MKRRTTEALAADASARDVDAYLRAQERKDLLRILTCGSVDDGKSTLIGRLLYDSQLILEDQLAALEDDSRRVGTVKGGTDFALLVDGLQAEREQGITIDVAYRYFATARRKFIVADAPGHEQYTRNMASGASHADLAVLLVDARAGVVTQTRRHSYIVSLLGIRDVLLAVNKMDLVDYDQAVFERVATDYDSFCRQLGIDSVTSIPVSALKGDNVVARSDSMAWYRGPALLPYLESVEIRREADASPFRMPVQWVNRSGPDFRGYCGTIAGGVLRPGDEVVVLPVNRTGRVRRIVTYEGELERAVAGQAIALEFEEQLDVSRGDLLAAADSPAEVTDQFQARLIWMSDHDLMPERQYLLKIGCHTVAAAVTELKYRVNVNTLEHVAAKTLSLNEVGVCNLALDRPIAYDPYAQNHTTGGFLLIDRFSNETVGAGMIDFGLRRATNLTWQDIDLDKVARAGLKGQRPCVLWFTGLSGSGKSTLANLVERKLHAMGRHTYLLDGDNVRHGLNKDLGFTEPDRVENIRRVAETARLFVDAGMIVVASFISPFRSERLMARELMEEGEFVEIFVDAPLTVCEQRDAKGLYAKARQGAIKNFTGIDSPYEPPDDAEIHILNDRSPPEEGADRVVAFLKERGYV